MDIKSRVKMIIILI
jgi:uncharacterized protein YajQ (UPF0234 family)